MLRARRGVDRKTDWTKLLSECRAMGIEGPQPIGIRTFVLFTRSRRMSDSLPPCQLPTSSRIREASEQ
jgi:hypothetical protein